MTDRLISILLVEDDKNLGLMLQDHLVDEGFNIVLRRDGEAALEAIQELHFDLCIFDIMLPKMDGIELSRKMRDMNATTPFVFLTSRGLKSDRIQGYQMGADDYIVKPFDPDELVFKIKAIVRRSDGHQATPQNYSVGGTTLILSERELKTPLATHHLSNKEAQLIALLFASPNQAVPRSLILKQIWGRNDYFTARSMDVYLSKVRKYLQDDHALEVANVHGYGFKLLVTVTNPKQREE